MNNLKSMDTGFVIVNNNKFRVYLAITEKEQMDGLMYIEPPLTSMAFIYPRPQVNRFWMKDVKSDLDIVFCYKGKIIEIVKAAAMDTTLVGKRQYSDLVLEFPPHIANRFNFKIGDDIKISLSKTAVNKILLE